MVFVTAMDFNIQSLPTLLGYVSLDYWAEFVFEYKIESIKCGWFTWQYLLA